MGLNLNYQVLRGNFRFWDDICKSNTNMKKILTILALACSLIASAQVKTDGSKTRIDGVIELDKTVHDFGDIMVSDGPQHCSFTVTNISGAPIAINNVVSSCGCTDVKWTREPLKAGASGKIDATFSNDQGPYPFDKNLTVYISGMKKPVILRLRGIAHAKKQPLSELYPQKWGPFAIKDHEIKLGNMEQGNQRSDAVNVANTGSKPIKVTFENVTPGLKIEVSPNPVPAGGTAKMTYTVTADRTKWGKSWYYADPVIDGKRYKGDGRRISIWAFIKENFSGMSKAEQNKAAQPIFASSTYNFGKIKAGTPVTATFTFTNQGKSDLVVYKADSDTPAAKPGSIVRTPAGGKGSFQVPVDTSKLPKGETLIVISLTTNSPLRPLVNLFIAGAIE